MKHSLLFLLLLGFVSTHPMNLLKDLKEKSEGLQYLYRINRGIAICFPSMIAGSVSLGFYALSNNTMLTLSSGALSAAGTLYVLGREGIYQKTKLQRCENYFLAVAAQKGDLEEIGRLCKNGAQVNAETDYHVFNGPRSHELICPLYAALSKNQIPAAKLLKRHGADVNLRIGSAQNTLAMLLAIKENRSDRLQVLTWLAGEGADLHAKNLFGYTAQISDDDKKILCLEKEQTIRVIQP